MADEQPDVVIIGAGFAGLAAAHTLCTRGLRVIILEATERVGGRAHTIHPYGGVPAELGPEYVHGEPEVTVRLLRAAGLEREDFPDIHHLRGDDGLIEQPDFWARFAKLLRHAPPAPRDMSAQDYLARERHRWRPEDTLMFAQLVEGFYAAPLADISIASIAADAGGVGDVDAGDNRQARVASGYGPLAEWLRTRFEHAGGRILYRHVVRAIDWTELSARIVFRHNNHDDSIRARRVIVTLPLGVLLARDDTRVQFYPALGDHARALDGLAMGQVVKLVACMREPVWEDYARTDKPLEFLHGRGTAFPTYWIRRRGDHHALTAWAGGPHALPLAGLASESLLARALDGFAQSVDMPRSALEAVVEHVHFHDYAADPFARGAYSYTRVGGHGSAENLARPLGDTLYFAGEATDAEYEGSVAGALMSGERAAHQILERISVRRAA